MTIFTQNLPISRTSYNNELPPVFYTVSINSVDIHLLFCKVICCCHLNTIYSFQYTCSYNCFYKVNEHLYQITIQYKINQNYMSKIIFLNCK